MIYAYTFVDVKVENIVCYNTCAKNGEENVKPV